MCEVEYVTPLGDEMSDLSEGFFDKLFTQDEEYWQDEQGCGCGTFELIETERVKAYLEVTFKKGFGYYLAFTDKTENVDHFYVAIGEIPESESVATLHHNGVRVFVPASMFTTKAVAMQVAKEFCQTGKRPECVKWATQEKSP